MRLFGALIFDRVVFVFVQAAEAEAIRQLRASMVHKALPIMAPSKVFQPQPASQPTTTPKSPSLQTKARAQQQIQQQQQA